MGGIFVIVKRKMVSLVQTNQTDSPWILLLLTSWVAPVLVRVALILIPDCEGDVCQENCQLGHRNGGERWRGSGGCRVALWQLMSWRRRF